MLGRTDDGCYGTIELRRPDARVFRGMPMRAERRCAVQQQERVRALGLCTAQLAVLRDLDRFRDAAAGAAETPATRFARTLAGIAGEPLGIAA